jgi:hypothetical protein
MLKGTGIGICQKLPGKKHKMRVFGNRVLNIIFGSNRRMEKVA